MDFILIFSKALKILSGCMVPFILIDSLRLIFRKNYGRRFLNLPAFKIERLLKFEEKVTISLKILLRLAVIVLIIIPTSFFFFIPELFILSTIWMVIFFIMVLLDYFFHRWFLNYLESNQI